METLEKCVSQAIDYTNTYHISHVLKFRGKKERANSIKSDCCTYPLPFIEENKGFAKLAGVISQKLVGYRHRTTKNRDKMIGVYGSVGVGKSRFIDYLCNEYGITKQLSSIDAQKLHRYFYLIPISLNDEMSFALTEKVVDQDSFLSIVGVRVLFSYFAKKEKRNVSNRNNSAVRTGNSAVRTGNIAEEKKSIANGSDTDGSNEDNGVELSVANPFTIFTTYLSEKYLGYGIEPHCTRDSICL